MRQLTLIEEASELFRCTAKVRSATNDDPRVTGTLVFSPGAVRLESENARLGNVTQQQMLDAIGKQLGIEIKIEWPSVYRSAAPD